MRKSIFSAVLVFIFLLLPSFSISTDKVYENSKSTKDTLNIRMDVKTVGFSKDDVKILNDIVNVLNSVEKRQSYSENEIQNLKNEVREKPDKIEVITAHLKMSEETLLHRYKVFNTIKAVSILLAVMFSLFYIIRGLNLYAFQTDWRKTLSYMLVVINIAMFLCLVAIHIAKIFTIGTIQNISSLL
jgi:hypothetical protein